MQPATASFRYCDLRVNTRWPSDYMAAFGRAVLEHHSLSPAPAFDGCADWHFDFAAEAGSVQVPAGAQEIGRHEHTVVLSRHGGDIYVQAGDAVARICPATGHLLAATGLDANRSESDLYFLIVFSILVLAQSRSLFAVHGACLCRGNTGILLVADSDSGKSTLSMALVREGWQFLSDDSLLVREQDGAVVAHPFRHDFALDPEAALLFPEVEHARVPRQGDPDKWTVDVDRIYPGQRIDCCKPDVLIFPQIADAEESVLAPMGATDTFLHLMSQCSFLDPHRAPAQIATLKKLIRQTTQFRLTAGRDVKQDPSLVSRMIAGILPPSPPERP